MKPSHYITPRTMEDATFPSWGQAIHGSPTHPYDWQDRVVMIGSAIIAIATVVILLLTGGAA